MQAIDIKDMSFSYSNNLVFENFNLTLFDGNFVSILGKNGSGKTTLVNILSGRLKCDGEILFFGKKRANNIEFIYDDMDEYDSYDKVINLFEPFNDKIENMALEFDFLDVLDCNFNYLPVLKKKLVILGLALLKDPKILVIDNFFEGVGESVKRKIIKKLKKKKILVVSFSNDTQEAIYADIVVIIGNEKVLLKGTKKTVFEKESFFESYDIEEPFIVNLSNKLKFYELVDKVYFSEKKLVDDLWQ